MSLGPAEIIIILFVALIAFGPKRLPEVARQVGSAVRELRRMQDTVRGELEQVLHPDFVPPAGSTTLASGHDTDHAPYVGAGAASGVVNDHGAGPDMTPHDMTPSDAARTAAVPGGPDADDNVTDDGFAGPRSFS